MQCSCSKTKHPVRNEFNLISRVTIMKKTLFVLGSSFTGVMLAITWVPGAAAALPMIPADLAPALIIAGLAVTGSASFLADEAPAKYKPRAPLPRSRF